MVIDKSARRTYTLSITVPAWLASYFDECATNLQYGYTLSVGIGIVLVWLGTATYIGLCYMLGLPLLAR